MQLPRQDMTSLFVDVGHDWSSKAIITALDKKGFSLRTLKLKLGLRENSIRNVFHRRVNCYQQTIAQAIRVNPTVVWPSRYHREKHKSA
ncbi:MAG: helix-turn-helix domain-containing protein [Sodalis sp. (in: enterobacteria)]|uniref:helix-turn-helix domain-containing protein n=1 Tax=Sodalis sp. (in: enterobacteria) TaxID=1898979 RepID=UPI003F3FD5E4